MDGQFGFDFEASREAGERFYEIAGEDAVAGEDIVQAGAEQQRDGLREHAVAEAMAGAIGGR